MTRGIVLPTEDGAERWVDLQIGDGLLQLQVAAYDPVAEEAARMEVHKDSEAAEPYGDLLALLSPQVQEGLATLRPDLVHAAGAIWLAALLGKDVITDWRGALDGDGDAVEFSVDRWQLAVFTVPQLGALFLREYLRPRTMEIAAGNASAPAPDGHSAGA